MQKSANVLLARGYTAKIADVGLAKILHHEFLSTMAAVGTFFWCAPEVSSLLPQKPTRFMQPWCEVQCPLNWPFGARQKWALEGPPAHGLLGVVTGCASIHKIARAGASSAPAAEPDAEAVCLCLCKLRALFCGHAVIPPSQPEPELLRQCPLV